MVFFFFLLLFFFLNSFLLCTPKQDRWKEDIFMCLGAIIPYLAVLIVERLTNKFNPGKEQASIHNIAYAHEINFSRMQLLYQVKLFICKIQCR